MRKPIVAGNWKMNKGGSRAPDGALALIKALRERLVSVRDAVEVVVAPPFTALCAVKDAIDGSNLILGAQNCHWEESGAFTGEISPRMLLEEGCAYVIVGHSERRQLFGETDATVNKKVHALLAAGLKPIACIGETLAEREAGKTLEVLGRQVAQDLAGVTAEQLPHVVIAYEPVWAIGTGKTATSAQAQEVHAHIRELLVRSHGRESAERVRIQYGGSVKPENAAELMSQPDIDGALVGGASLKAADFEAIVLAKL